MLNHYVKFWGDAHSPQGGMRVCFDHMGHRLFLQYATEWLWMELMFQLTTIAIAVLLHIQVRNWTLRAHMT